MKKKKDVLILSLVNPGSIIPQKYIKKLLHELTHYTKDKDFDILLLPEIIVTPMKKKVLKKIFHKFIEVIEN